MTKEIIEIALNQAFRLGQTYWQQSDSDSYIQHDKSDQTLAALKTLITNTLTNIAQPVQPATEYLQFLSDVMTAAGLVTYGKQCKALGERLRIGCAKFRIAAQPVQPALSNEAIYKLWMDAAPTDTESHSLVFARSVIAAQAAQPVQPGWQPIETAPSNTEVLVGAAPDGYSVASLVRWSNGWDWVDSHRDLQWEPTHWMPKPPLPESKE